MYQYFILNLTLFLPPDLVVILYVPVQMGTNTPINLPPGCIQYPGTKYPDQNPNQNPNQVSPVNTGTGNPKDNDRQNVRMQNEGNLSEMGEEEKLRGEDKPAEEEKVGVYSKEERLEKIARYKAKLKKWRDLHPVKRKYPGRARIAEKKPRVKGKFVPKEIEMLNHTIKKDKYSHFLELMSIGTQSELSNISQKS